jgi:hypothetical protein
MGEGPTPIGQSARVLTSNNNKQQRVWRAPRAAPVNVVIAMACVCESTKKISLVADSDLHKTRGTAISVATQFVSSCAPLATSLETVAEKVPRSATGYNGPRQYSVQNDVGS